MGPEIAEQRVADAAHAFGPRLQCGNLVYRDAQNLSIQSLELGQISLVRRDLARSYWRPGQRKKSKDNIFSPQVAQLHLAPQMCRQAKVRRFLPHLEFHNVNSSEIDWYILLDFRRYNKRNGLFLFIFQPASAMDGKQDSPIQPPNFTARA